MQDMVMMRVCFPFQVRLFTHIIGQLPYTPYRLAILFGKSYFISQEPNVNPSVSVCNVG